MFVSVIIPCYNVEEYIQECVESVVAQTYKNIEIICVDNNSTDNTWSILCDLKDKYQLVLEKEFKTGACAARNKGLQIAKGEWIQFLDADDLLLKSKIEHQVALLKNEDLGFIAGAWTKKSIKGIEKEIVQFNSNLFIAVFKSQSGNTCSNLWNKKILDNVNGWNENLKSSQEADLMMRIVLNNNRYLIDKVSLTIIRERENGQISQTNTTDNLERFIKVRLFYLNELENKFPKVFTEFKNELFSYLLAFIVKLYHYSPYKALELYNNHIKSKISIDLKYKNSSLIKLIGLKLFVQLQK